MTTTTDTPTSITGLGTKVRQECRRCDGTGLWFGIGICFNCQGAGTVTSTRYTPDEKVQIARYTARRTAALTAIRAHGAEMDKVFRYRHQAIHEDHAVWGMEYLESRENHRMDALFTSVENGRVDAVVRALGEYFRAIAEAKGTGTGSAYYD